MIHHSDDSPPSPSVTPCTPSTPCAPDQNAGRESVLSKLREVQSAHPGRSRIARILGRDPLSPDARSWFVGALGEIDVAHRLRTLGASGGAWRVLHSVPVGERGADVDHVVIGPAGVFTLNTKHHAGSKVWVGQKAVLVAGRRVPYLSKARAEAERTARLLEDAVGHPVAVRPLIVVVGAGLTTKQQPDDVTVVEAARLVRHLRSLPETQSIDEVRAVTRAALQPKTWRPQATRSRPTAAAADTPEPETIASADTMRWFAGVRAEVRRAQRVRFAWAGAAVVAVLVAADAVVVELPRILAS